MVLKTAFEAMLPNWLMGAMILFASIKLGYGRLLRVEPKPIAKWMKFLFFLTIYRIVLFKLFPNIAGDKVEAITAIPWQLTLGVFWEDMVFSFPLLLLRHIVGTKWFTWPLHAALMALSMIVFGLGHTYQGDISAMILSLYIPAGVYLGKKYGYGTVMAGHTLYDLSTVLVLKLIVGA